MARIEATRRQEATVAHVDASPEGTFAFLDDHRKLSSHMSKRSWRMGGGMMRTTTDDAHGKAVGSRISMEGRVLGVRLGLDEVVTRRDPPRLKEWQTIGTPRLLVVGPYTMRAELTPSGEGTDLRVSIDYALPERGRWLGRLFGRAYARWCVRQMARDVVAGAKAGAKVGAGAGAGAGTGAGAAPHAVATAGATAARRRFRS